MRISELLEGFYKASAGWVAGRPLCLLLFALIPTQQGMGPGPGTPHSAGGAAIAFDQVSVSAVATSSLTASYSATVGSGLTNSAIYVGVATNTGNTTTPVVNYGAATMTLVSAVGSWHAAAGTNFIFKLLSPPSGTATVLITYTGGTPGVIYSQAVSYSGVAQTYTEDSTPAGTGGPSGSTAVSNTTTTVADNSWTLMFVANSSSRTYTAGTGTTQRYVSGPAYVSFFDTNAPVHPAGSATLSATLNFGAYWGAAMISFAHA